MAADTADFYLRLHEKVNAPARKAEAAVRRLSGGLIASRQELARTEVALRKHFAAQQRVGSKGIGGSVFGGTLTGNLAARGIEMAASGVREAASAVAEMGRSFVVATFDAVNFGQRSRLALTSILGDAKLAGQQFAAVRSEAATLGLPFEDAVDSFRSLVNARFDVGTARELVRMSADLQAMTGSAESAKFALRAITQVKMKGRLMAEELTGQLAEHGVSADVVYSHLGKTLGKTRREILAMQQAGKLSADTAIPAILSAVRDQLGVQRSGEFAEMKGGGTVGGQITRTREMLRAQFSGFADEVSGPVTQITSRVNEAMLAIAKSPAIAAVKEQLVGTFYDTARWVESNWPEIKSTVVGVAASLAEHFGTAAAYIRDHGAELRSTFRTIADASYLVALAGQDVLRVFAAISEAVAAVSNKFREYRTEIQTVLSVAGKVLPLLGQGGAGAAFGYYADKMQQASMGPSFREIGGQQLRDQPQLRSTAGLYSTANPILGDSRFSGKQITNNVTQNITVESIDHQGKPEDAGDALGNASLKKFLGALETA
jgi:tape measure domain-containing protein